MALQIKLRNGTAASWTSTNPTLSQGEPGTENDTGRFKIGTGALAWASLGYADPQGGAQVDTYRSFGIGDDGDVTISVGTTTLSRDMFYNNLTLSGTGILSTNGYRVFVKGILDMTACAAGAIQINGSAGGDASGTTGGSAGAAVLQGTVGGTAAGAAGSNGGTGTGSTGTGGPTITAGMGGGSGPGGIGGTGTSGAGGAGGPGRGITASTVIARYETNFMSGITLMAGGPGGAAGGTGAGDGVNSGGGSGAGGSGAGILPLFANKILTSASTPVGAIQCNGGAAGAGGNPPTGVCGGGGGGGGGAGGWIYIAYNARFGPLVLRMIQCNGGAGGRGGTGIGTGASGGNGGEGGSPGRITIIRVNKQQAKEYKGGGGPTMEPAKVGSISVGQRLEGANGGIGTVNEVDF